MDLTRSQVMGMRGMWSPPGSLAVCDNTEWMVSLFVEGFLLPADLVSSLQGMGLSFLLLERSTYFQMNEKHAPFRDSQQQSEAR